jgi:hypothetical protein
MSGKQFFSLITENLTFLNPFKITSPHVENFDSIMTLVPLVAFGLMVHPSPLLCVLPQQKASCSKGEVLIHSYMG